jgi:DNA-binding transcriptional ArsR family regulator
MTITVRDENPLPFLALPHAAIRSPRLKPLHKLLLFALMSHADNSTRTTFISHGTLAKEMASSRPTIQRAMKDLAEAGYLTVTERPGESQVYSLDSQEIVQKLTGTCNNLIEGVYQNDRGGSIKSLHREEPNKEDISKKLSIETPEQLLAVFSEDEWATIRSKYPGLDYDHEAMKCVVWCQEHNKPIKGPKSRYYGWLDTAMKSGQNGKAAATQPRAADDPNPVAKYEAFAKEWKQH